ncbi:hypothetical protein H0H93_011364, partial [Arthromyces matolae]
LAHALWGYLDTYKGDNQQQSQVVLTMLFSTVVLYTLASLSTLPSEAAPIPNHLRVRATSHSDGGWPTSTDSSAESAFGISGNFKVDYLKTIDGQPTLVGTYPEGSYAGSKDIGIGGFIFEATGGSDDGLKDAKEATLTYQVQFPSGFQPAYGGKLPGFYGGTTPSIAKTCAGGHHDNNCWSARLMWREKLAGELYAYLPTSNSDVGKADSSFGHSVGRGDYSFTAGEWTTITERVLLNDVGQKNGQIEVSVNGASKILSDKLELRGTEEGRIVGVMMHTFFGGSSDEKYKSPKDQKAYFRGFSVTTTKKLS